ncbi:MAG TPA: hypothetical protein VHV51_13795 [Polyangiaceae bacterium]|nr:hypothetical protein [Polyangiaceae bacterium]
MGAFARSCDFAFERPASGFSLGANPLALGFLRFAIGFAFGLLGFTLFLFSASCFFALSVTLGDLLKALFFLGAAHALALFVLRLLRGELRGLLFGLLARFRRLFFLQRARAFSIALFLEPLGFFGLLRFESLGLLALLSLIPLFLEPLGFFGLLRFEPLGRLGLLLAVPLLFLFRALSLLSELQPRGVLLGSGFCCLRRDLLFCRARGRAFRRFLLRRFG